MKVTEYYIVWLRIDPNRPHADGTSTAVMSLGLAKGKLNHKRVALTDTANSYLLCSVKKTRIKNKSHEISPVGQHIGVTYDRDLFHNNYYVPCFETIDGLLGSLSFQHFVNTHPLPTQQQKKTSMKMLNSNRETNKQFQHPPYPPLPSYASRPQSLQVERGAGMKKKILRPQMRTMAGTSDIIHLYPKQDLLDLLESCEFY